VSPTSAPVPQSQPLQSHQSPPAPPAIPQSQPTQSAAAKGLGQVFQAGLSRRDDLTPQQRFEGLEGYKNQICSDVLLGQEIRESLNTQSQKTREEAYALGADDSKKCEYALREFRDLLLALLNPKNGAPVASAQPQVNNLLSDILPDNVDAAAVPQAQQAAFDAIAALRKISTDANRLGNLVKSDSLAPKIGSLTSKIDGAVSALNGRVEELGKGELPAAKLVEGYQAVAGDARTATALGKEIEDGWRELDKMVASLDGAAKSAEDQRFVAEALKLRYDLELGKGMGRWTLPKLYNVLGMVPASHTTGNDHLKKVTHGGLLDAYNQSAIGLYVTKDREAIINVWSTPTVFPRQKASGERTWFDGFSFTTLHEVGHSVDDKLGFMNGKAGIAEYGGWKTESPELIAPIVAAAMNFYHFRQFPAAWFNRYLVTVLKTGAPPPNAGYIAKAQEEKERTERILNALSQAATNDTFRKIENKRRELTQNAVQSDVAWQDARRPYLSNPPKIGELSYSEVSSTSQRLVTEVLKKKNPLAAAIETLRSEYPPTGPVPTAADLKAMAAHKAVKWCQSIRDKLWDKGPGGAAALAVGDRVYQKFGDGDDGGSWTSYALAARGAGVSDYQFRAAGEWFAELYAFYYSKKLPESHPAYGWLHDHIDV
jgi:hypothetical protein